MKICPVCLSDNNKIVYSNIDVSITSLVKIVHENTIVLQCKTCTHVFTKAFNNINDYYDIEYKILTSSEEEDQLYVSQNGEKEFRLPYQAKLFDMKIKIEDFAYVLDYGCAKASTLRYIAQNHPNIEPICYDISSSYVPFWNAFVKKEYMFANELVSDHFNNKVDCVTSFFSLEHAENPIEYMRDIYRLLKTGGKLFCIVPNIFLNWADLIVVDHLNHFTPASIKTLLSASGFELLDLDAEAYTGAYVFIASKIEDKKIDYICPTSEYEIINRNINQITDYWVNLNNNISSISRNIDSDNYMIYGAGFYGGYITTLLKKKPCFYIDENPHLQGKKFFDVDVISIDNVPTDIKNIIVGLNPKYARNIMNGNTVNLDKSHNLIYIG